MDVNSGGGVSWLEFERFFSKEASILLVLPPYLKNLQYHLLLDVDQDGDGKLNLSDFVLYIYCLFFRAHCNRCQRDLFEEDCITCADCFAYAVNQSDYATFDVCSVCNSNGFTHYHPSSQMKKLHKEVIFSEMSMVVGCQGTMATGSNFMAHAHSGMSTSSNTLFQTLFGTRLCSHLQANPSDISCNAL